MNEVSGGRQVKRSSVMSQSVWQVWI